MIFKIQYDDYESGEFTEEKSADLIRILDIVNSNTQIVEASRSFTICKPYIKFFLQSAGNYLRIEHFAKDAFSVEFCNEPDNKLYQGNFYKPSVVEIIEDFALENFDRISKKIPRTKTNEIELIKRFKDRDFTYGYHQKGVIWLVINLCISLFMLIFLVKSIIQTKYEIFGFLILSLFSLFYFLMALFHILLNHNYRINSKGKSIKISSGSPDFEYSNNFEVVKYSKCDIEEVEFYEASGYRNPFIFYSYSKIKLKSKQIIIIPHMLIDSVSLGHKLKNVPAKKFKTFYPYIRNST